MNHPIHLRGSPGQLAYPSQTSSRCFGTGSSQRRGASACDGNVDATTHQLWDSRKNAPQLWCHWHAKCLLWALVGGQTAYPRHRKEVFFQLRWVCRGASPHLKRNRQSNAQAQGFLHPQCTNGGSIGMQNVVAAKSRHRISHIGVIARKRSFG